MRKKEKEITDPAAMESIIRRSRVCRLAMSEDNRPYVVPLCFGYRDRTLYFHCAREGRKTDILRRNNRVCVEFDIDQELVTAAEACKFDMKFRSVIGFGKAFLVEDPEERRKGLEAIMAQYAGKSFSYPDEIVGKTLVIRVEVESLTGKQAGF
jgi:nitroimidazol reductase NimA-like FMN-containing flavoprotein (pyridoxamine 5'-phosphate oxidase superfamily)